MILLLEFDNNRTGHGIGDTQIIRLFQAQPKCPRVRSRFARKSLAVRERLAAVDPVNAGRQIDPVVILYKLAQLGDDARAHLQRALTILRQLDAEGRLPGHYKDMIAEFERMVASGGRT